LKDKLEEFFKSEFELFIEFTGLIRWLSSLQCQFGLCSKTLFGLIIWAYS